MFFFYQNGNEKAPTPLPNEDKNKSKELETSTPPIEYLDQGRMNIVETPVTPIETSTSSTSPEINAEKSDELLDTPLSPREMVRLSRHITIYWDPLAGEMGISSSQRDDIRNNTIYTDHRSRAEKVLSIFNNSKSFSRKTLAKCFEGLKKLDLIQPIIAGKWRNL